MHVRRSLGGVVLVFMNATGIQYFAGNHILTKTYYGSPLEVARAPQSPAQHSTILVVGGVGGGVVEGVGRGVGGGVGEGVGQEWEHV